eukprot:gene32302-33031_t
MFAIFNRFNPAYEEAARDLGATPWQTFRHVVLPLIAPSVVGIGMFGFTLSWDEIARTTQAIGDVNTLPLELQGLTTTVTTPSIYALGTVTMVVSFLVMGLAVGLSTLEFVALTENEIYERMVATILDHRLPPGTKLIEEKLASAFGVSRTRIRPVLVRL